MICYANDTVQRTTAAVLVATCNALADGGSSRIPEIIKSLIIYYFIRNDIYLRSLVITTAGRHPTQRIHAEPVSYVPGTTSYPG